MNGEIDVHARSAGAADGLPTKLTGAIRPYGYFALSFGGIVGSGWIVVLGDWLRMAGPGGAVLGLLGGGVLMTLVCACYAELAARFPEAGGEVLYAMRCLGRGAAFAVAWFLVFHLIAVCAFEGIALTWFVQTLVPSSTGPLLYTVLGEKITLGGVLIGLLGVALAAGLNYRGVRLAVAFQSIVTYAFIGLTAVLMVTGFIFGQSANLLPIFAAPDPGKSWLTGAIWIGTSSALFLSGFQVAPYAIEERHRSTSVRSLIIAMLLGVIGAALFYCGIVLSAASASPWTHLINENLPAAAAFGSLTPGGWLGTAVIVIATASLFKTWNCTLLAVTRLVFAQCRLGFLPSVFGTIHPRFGSPSVAILCIAMLNAAGVLLGRGALLPIVNMCSTFLALIFLLVLCVLYKERRASPATPAFAVIGGRILIPLGAVALAGVSVVLVHEPWERAGGRVPVEWILVLGWALLGALCFGLLGRREALRNSSEVQAVK
jgi:basic amino acid/polyamine antiporter, APA family